MRPNLTFDVTIDGDTLTGTSKAGMLPTSKVTETRAAHNNASIERRRAYGSEWSCSDLKMRR